MDTVTIRPTFRLKGVDPQQVIQRYLNGEYRSLTLPKAKVSVSVADISLDRKLTNNYDDEVYEFTDRSGQRQRIVTVNYSTFEAKRTGKSVTHLCRWCRLPIEATTDPIGIPMLQEYDPVNNISTFHTEGTYNCFECVYAHIKACTQTPWPIRNQGYCSSEILLRRLFSICYPEEKLYPAPDWILLNSNGGSLTSKEYFSKYHLYKQLSMVRLFPVKLEYVVVERPRARLNINVQTI